MSVFFFFLFDIVSVLFRVECIDNILPFYLLYYEKQNLIDN